MCTIIASLNKTILWKKIHTTADPGIPPCPPNHTENRSIRDLLDTPDPKDELPTVQIQNLKPLKARVQLIKTEESE